MKWVSFKSPASAFNVPASSGESKADAGNLQDDAGESPATSIELPASAFNVPATSFESSACSGTLKDVAGKLVANAAKFEAFAGKSADETFSLQAEGVVSKSAATVGKVFYSSVFRYIRDMGVRPDEFVCSYFDEWKSAVEIAGCKFTVTDTTNSEELLCCLELVCTSEGLDASMVIKIAANDRSIDVELLRYNNGRGWYHLYGDDDYLKYCILAQLKAAGCTTDYHGRSFKKVKVWRIDKGFSYDLIDRIENVIADSRRMKYKTLWRSKHKSGADQLDVTFSAALLKVGFSRWEVWTGPIDRKSHFIAVRPVTIPPIPSFYDDAITKTMEAIGGVSCLKEELMK